MPDQPQLVQAFDTIRRMATTTKKTEKEKILKGNQSEYLQTLLRLAYNKFITFGVKQIEQPGKYNSLQPDTLEDFVILCDKLATRKLSGNAAGSAITAFLAKQSPDGAIIYTNVLLRDLRGGFDEKTINKVFPGSIPVFDIQLGCALDKWERLEYPIGVDEKIDGIRCPAIYNGETVRFYSRNGFEFETGFDCFSDQIKTLLPGVPFMLDCEFRAHKFNPKDTTCQKHKKGNWKFEYAKGLSRRKEIDPKEMKEFFKLYIWDMVDLDYFESQGLRGSCLPLKERKIRLAAMFARHGLTFGNLEIVQSFEMNSKAEILEYMRELKVKGLEGCMLKPLELPYTFGKNYTIIKLKHFSEGDVRIVDVYPGEKGKKYENILGGITIGTDDGKIRCNMGSGFSDAQRADLWLAHLRGELVGKIVEVQYKDITADGCFQLPTLIRFREDRDTTNTYEELMTKMKAEEE